MLLQAVNFTGYRLIRRTLQVTYIVTDELSQAKEQRLNQFGTAILIQCSKVVKFITRSAALLHIRAAADLYGALLMCRTKCINYSMVLYDLPAINSYKYLVTHPVLRFLCI